MEIIFWNITSTGINIPVNVPNGINGIEYLFQQENIYYDIIYNKVPLELMCTNIR